MGRAEAIQGHGGGGALASSPLTRGLDGPHPAHDGDQRLPEGALEVRRKLRGGKPHGSAVFGRDGWPVVERIIPPDPRPIRKTSRALD